MDISSSNPYQHLAQYQQPITVQPIDDPSDPVTIPEYQPPELSPEQRIELRENVNEKIDGRAEELDAQKEALRQYTVGYVGTQSKKTQWEIYMQGTTGSAPADDAPSGVEFYRTLRDIQEQNNLIKAYAAYQENAPVA